MIISKEVGLRVAKELLESSFTDLENTLDFLREGEDVVARLGENLNALGEVVGLFDTFCRVEELDLVELSFTVKAY